MIQEKTRAVSKNETTRFLTNIFQIITDRTLFLMVAVIVIIDVMILTAWQNSRPSLHR